MSEIILALRDIFPNINDDLLLVIEEFAIGNECITYYSHHLVEKYAPKFDWDFICRWEMMTKPFILEFSRYFVWSQISFRKMPKWFVKKYWDSLDWLSISSSSHLTDDFIRENVDKVDWELISSSKYLSQEMLEEFSDRIHWRGIKRKLPEPIINKYDVYWPNISIYQPLTPEFVSKHKAKLDWNFVMAYHNLNEDLIDPFANDIRQFISKTNSEKRALEILNRVFKRRICQ